jgi:hypothetical protein
MANVARLYAVVENFSTGSRTGPKPIGLNALPALLLPATASIEVG